MAERLARWSLYATAAVSLFVMPGFYFPYVTLRSILFRLLTAIAAACFVLALRGNRLRGHDLRDPLLISLAAFCVVTVLSAASGVAPWRSFFGDFERMWGVVAWLHFLLYYVLLRIYFHEEDWRTFFNLLLITGGTACAITIVQRAFGVVRPAGVLGNPGYLSIYALLLSALAGWGLTGNSGLNRKAAIWALVTGALGFVAAGTRGALLGLLVAAAWMVANLPVVRAARFRNARIGFLTLVLAVIGITQTPLVRYLPVMIRRLAATSVEGSDSIRLIAWRGALSASSEKPLLGWGPENAGVAFNRHFDPAYYLILPHGDRLDRFHNAFVEALATTGSVGLFAYIAFWVAALWTIRRAFVKGRLSRLEYLLFGGLVTAFVTYFLFWFEDLSSFAALLAVLAFVRFRLAQGSLLAYEPSVRPNNVIPVAGLVAILAYALVDCVLPLRAAYYLEKADGSPQLSVEARVRDFETALAPPVPQRMHTLLRYAVFIRNLADRPDAIRGDQYRQAQIARSMRELRRQVAFDRSRDPQNDLWSLIEAQISVAELAIWRSPLSYYDAVRAYQEAIKLSPERIRHRLALARTYLLARDTTRAIAELRTASGIYPRLGETYGEMSSLYLRADRPQLATSYCERAVASTYRCDRRDFSKILKYLAARNEWARLHTLLRDDLAAYYGPDWLTTREARVAPEDRDLVLLMGLSAVLSEQTRSLKQLSRFARAHDAMLRPLVDRLTEDAAAGRLAEWVPMLLTDPL